MDESWRFRPLPSSICPTCSFPHFPFCHPPPRFFHPRPPHDPTFPIHLAPPPLQHPFPIPGRGVEDVWDQRTLSEDFAQREGLYKRMRVDERGVGGWTQLPPPGPGRLGLEDERRLNLIRDHGHQQQHQRVQLNGYAYPTDRHTHEGLNNQLENHRNPELDSFGRNRVVDSLEVKSLSCSGGLESYWMPPAMGTPSPLGFHNFINQEKSRILEIQQDGNSNARFNSVDVECGNMQYHQSDGSGQPAKCYRYDRAGVAASERHMLNHQHLEDNVHKRSWGQVPAYASQQQALKKEFNNRYHRQCLPPGTTSAPGRSSPYGNGYQAQASLAVDVESYRHRDFGLVHSMQNAGENMCEFHGHMGNLARSSFEHKTQSSEDMRVLRQFEAQKYPVLENSQVPSSIDTDRHLPMSSVSDVVVSMSSQVGSMANYPPLPSRRLPSPLPEVSVSHLQQTNISPFMHQKPAKQYLEEGNSFALQHPIAEKPKIVDASHIFKKPHRATRPGHIAIILRGLPGSGKSYLAKALRDIEVENGGSAPRVHSMDDYFMTEVEKVEEVDGTKSSTSVKGKKQFTKTVMEYCYEPEMEEAYRASMLRAFKKTVEEGIFTFVIVDDRNLRVADFAQFWAIGKSSGYEVYLLEAAYKDPIGCAARNVHGFTSDAIQKMAEKWEEAPSLYLQIDIQPLFNEDKLNDHNILEVDMDTEDATFDEGAASAVQKETDEATYLTSDDSVKGGRWVAEEESYGVKELGSSKWSKNTDEDNEGKIECKNHSNALSGLLKAYSISGKSVHWGDQVEKRGFSIGAAKCPSISSLIIGPGIGYNLNSNPLPKDEADLDTGKGKANGLQKHSIFLEHLRAERESFKAVFDKRRQRIGGLCDADDD